MLDRRRRAVRAGRRRRATRGIRRLALLRPSQEAPAVRRTSRSRRSPTSAHGPRQPDRRFQVDLAGSSTSSADPRRSLELTPENLVALEPGGDRSDLRPADRRADPRRGLSRRPVLRPRATACAPAAGDPRRHRGRLAGEKIELVERLGRALWKGKMFDREQTGAAQLHRGRRAARGPDRRSRAPSRRPRCRARAGPLMPTTSVWLLFPAKLYCGQSLLDGRREAVIVDYLFNDEIEGYQPSPDSLAGRSGLRIRDEIRMVRPGLLSRARLRQSRLPAQLHALQPRGRRCRDRRLRRGRAHRGGLLARRAAAAAGDPAGGGPVMRDAIAGRPCGFSLPRPWASRSA